MYYIIIIIIRSPCCFYFAWPQEQRKHMKNDEIRHAFRDSKLGSAAVHLANRGIQDEGHDQTVQSLWRDHQSNPEGSL